MSKPKELGGELDVLFGHTRDVAQPVLHRATVILTALSMVPNPHPVDEVRSLDVRGAGPAESGESRVPVNSREACYATHILGRIH